MIFLLSCVKQYTLEIDVAPSHSAVLINDLPSCSEKPCVMKLPKAQYRITVLAPDYAKEHMDVLLAKDERLVFSLTPKRGDLDIESAPTNLLINVDGEVRGHTPLALSLSKGTHKIWVQDSCFTHQEQEYHVRVGEKQHVLLQPQPKTQMRHIDVEGAPPGQAAILIDGLLVGQSPFFGAIPVCARTVTAIWGSKIGFVALSQESDSENIVVVPHEAPIDQVPDFLGYVPPICRNEAGIDTQCMDTWIKEKKREFDKRNAHTHHEGCSH